MKSVYNFDSRFFSVVVLFGSIGIQMKMPARIVVLILKWKLRGKRKQRRKSTVSQLNQFLVHYFYSSLNFDFLSS